MQTLGVTSKQNKTRLDLFLKLSLPNYSRSSVRKMLDLGKVKVGSEVEYRPNYRVKTGEIVQIEVDEDMKRRHQQGMKMGLDIVYKDEDIVIVNKPSGLKVHPSRANETNTLINGLYGDLEGELGEFGVNLVNRIDKGTSGLVVAAISARGAWHYSKMFSQSKVEKYYLAVVPGRWSTRYEPDEVVKVANFLNYDWQKRIQTVDKHSGNYAVTTFRLLQTSADEKWSMVEAKPLTGRTHQIRIHLSFIHSPILGDKKYGGEEHSRLMLHAHKLVIPKVDSDEVISVETDIPTEFDKLMK